MAAPSTTTISFTPFAMPPLPAFDNQFLQTWIRVGSVYKDTLDASAQDLFMSSARIIQEHTVRAFVSAAQACAQALAENATKVQQQSLVRFASANQKAVEIMGQAWIEGMTAPLRQAR